MKVTRVESPAAIVQPQGPDLKARAIEAFNKAAQTPQAQEQQASIPVDANNISAEEIGAVKAKPVEQVDNSTTSEPETRSTTQEIKQAVKDPETERRFAELDKQERAVRARAQKQSQEFKAQQAAIDAQKADIAAQIDRALQDRLKGYIAKDRLKADPVSALAEAETSYDDIVQKMLNPLDPRVDAQIKRLESTIQSLQSKLEEGNKAQAEAQTQQYKAALKQIERDAVELVRQDPQAYETVAKTGSIKDIVDLIERTYEKDGVVMSVDEAAREVEDYLAEEVFKTASRIEKVKRRLAQGSTNAVQPKQEKTAKPADTKQPGTMKTLTNAQSSTRQLSARERALLAFKGELKS